MNNTPTVRVDVPARFFADHIGRDCSESAVVVKRLARTVRVDLDRAAYDDLLSDAEHYGGGAMDDMYADDFASASGLIRSARATARALRAVGRPAEAVPACEWFALCANPATGTTPHPILGDVPTCDRCADRASS
jgi:hypothetical protein